MSTDAEYGDDSECNEDLLERFRRQWQNEIAASARATVTQEAPSNPVPQSKKVAKLDQENKAVTMYLEGVKCEQSGRVVDAIRHYKRAMQLVPDIEQKMYGTTKTKEELDDKGPQDRRGGAAYSDEDDDQEGPDDEDESDEDGDDDSTDVLAKCQRHLQRHRKICSHQVEQRSMHISALPYEVMVYLLKWVVSSDLDLRSLEQAALVCRGFYVCCRDTELWKLVCAKVWSADCGSPQRHGYATWREMFIERPRLLFGGCYIGKTTYVRAGENSFQDPNFQPWHLVTYFRYLRFFPEGLVLMMTSADGPNSTLGHLRRRTGQASSVQRGTFTLSGDAVSAVFRQQRKPPAADGGAGRYRRGRRQAHHVESTTVVEQVFELELKLRPHKKRRHWTLHWSRYVISVAYVNGERQTTPVDVGAGSSFPPLFFSRVRSYTAESETPLSLT